MPREDLAFVPLTQIRRFQSATLSYVMQGSHLSVRSEPTTNHWVSIAQAIRADRTSPFSNGSTLNYFFFTGAADLGAESFFFWLSAEDFFCFCSFCLLTDFGDLSPIIFKWGCRVDVLSPNVNGPPMIRTLDAHPQRSMESRVC